MNKNNETASINLIGAGTTIKGDIISDGDIRIDGTLQGSVRSKGKVVIGATGTMDGEAFCQNADVSGVVNGQITVTELLALKATAKLNGDITTDKLAIEPGATFTGSCSMGGVIKDINNGEKTEAQFKEKTA